MKLLGFGKAVTGVCAISTLAACAFPQNAENPPQTAAECRAQYAEARDRGRNASVHPSAAGALGGLIGLAIAESANTKRLNNCYDSVGAAAYDRRPVTNADVQQTRQTNAANRVALRNGKLPLPAEYPLLEGDAELWPTLTLEQQERAIEFLETGSTIRSSLKPD